MKNAPRKPGKSSPLPTVARPKKVAPAPDVPAGSIGCGGCDGWWRGLSMAHCPVCHRTFGSADHFIRHRVRGRCRTPESIGLAWNATRRAWTKQWEG